MSIPSQIIKQKAQDAGFDLVGICQATEPEGFEFYKEWLNQDFHASMKYMEDSIELRKSPQSILPNAKSIIGVLLNYNQPNEPELGMPRISTYALGRDYHKVIKGKLKKIARELKEIYPKENFRSCVDSVPIFDREYAQKAGLGWFGKNSCLINTKRGSYFCIGLLLTTLEIEPDQPAIGYCGNCTLCIEACPTGAIVHHNDRWQIDARKCISYWNIEHKGEIDPEIASKMGDWTYGCDICQDVCPFNQARDHQPLRAQKTKEKDYLAKKKWPKLVELAQISYEDWDQLTQGSAVRRAGWEGLKRNSTININNLSE